MLSAAGGPGAAGGSVASAAVSVADDADWRDYMDDGPGSPSVAHAQSVVSEPGASYSADLFSAAGEVESVAAAPSVESVPAPSVGSVADEEVAEEESSSAAGPKAATRGKAQPQPVGADSYAESFEDED